MKSTVSFSKIQKKVDKLHRKQIEAQGAKKELMKEMQSLGFGSVSDLKKAADKLNQQIKEKQDEMESKLKLLEKMLKRFDDAK